MFFATTSTPGISAPLESETVPFKTAFTCANVKLEVIKMSNVAAIENLFIGSSTNFRGADSITHYLYGQTF
jgi:hypothetical protein